MKYDRLIELINESTTMDDVQHVTAQVKLEFESTDFVHNGEQSKDEKTDRHNVYNVLSDKTFEVFLKENPKSKVTKKTKTKAKPKTTKAKVKTKPTRTKQLVKG